MAEESRFKNELIEIIVAMQDLRDYRKKYGEIDKQDLKDKYNALYDVAIEYLINYRGKYENISNLEKELKNEKLTWEELREFIDKPVYLVRGSNSYWIIVKELRYGKDGFYVLSDRDNPYPIAYCEFYRKEHV